MSDRLPMIEAMEEALARMLAEAEQPPASPAEPSAHTVLPPLTELLAPAHARLIEAEQQVRAADALLEDAGRALSAWRQRGSALKERLALYDNRDDPSGAQATG